MRLHYVLLLVAAVFLSSIDASTATTATSINSRLLVSAEQDKTDGKRFLRAEVKDEEHDDEEDRVSLSSLFGAFTKWANKAQKADVEEAIKKYQGKSDDFITTHQINFGEYDVKLSKAWAKHVKENNKVNPEGFMYKTLVDNIKDKADIGRWIQVNRDASRSDKVFTKLQKLYFTDMKKYLEKRGIWHIDVFLSRRPPGPNYTKVTDKEITTDFSAFLKRKAYV